MHIKTLVSTAITIALLVRPAHGQDSKGSKDHPAIQRYEGSTIIDYDTKNFESLLIPIAKLSFNGKHSFPNALQPEGQVTRILYKAPVGRTSLEVFRNYERALKAAGFQILYSCTKAACGDGDTFAQNLFGVGAQPLTLNQQNQAFLSAKLARPTGTMYVRLFTVENRSWAAEAKTAEGQVIAQLDIVETKAMEGGMVTVDANAMLKALQTGGRVALYGIYFDSGSAVVKPESKPAIDEIANLMSSNPSLRLLVVGHTDTDGSMSANRELSEKRAAAVVQQLVSGRGIAQSRLTPFGVGFAAPVATNRTPDGKAKNRRVELVEY
jgi:outer membrane protein OmpA-like peptidoglycan-associated protein